ncbi:MAG: hypothetical protein C5B55_01025 [Blastocatellia bacterium]|nr:MAG: hypothetical protein C5B55_01025 [Blastocatellia bacterium]
MNVTLTIHSVEGIKELLLDEGSLTIGRSNEADIVIDDDSLSRVHASLNRDGERVWITDEGSRNGSFVNGREVPPEGTALVDADEIGLGNTTIVVNLRNESNLSAQTEPESISSNGLPIPLIAAGAGIVIIVLTALLIGLAYRNTTETISMKKPGPLNNDSSVRTPESSPSPSLPDVATPEPSMDQNDLSNQNSRVTSSKQYLAMTTDERREFIQNQAQNVATMIGNRKGYSLSPVVVAKIKYFVDAYAARLHSPKPSGGCNMKHDLTTLLNRAGSYAPVVIRSFNEKGLAPQVGIYLAMIEAEFCPCLFSGTGPKGYFQFASSTARRYGVKDVSSWQDRREDDRCKIDIMAPIAAQYMKDLIARFGTGPMSVPLAVASYNEGEYGLDENLKKSLQAADKSDNPERSFWTMVEHTKILSPQFQKENINYVPKFFGAAIVGENPRVFGVDLSPISSYAQPQRGISAGQ